MPEPDPRDRGTPRPASEASSAAVERPVWLGARYRLAFAPPFLARAFADTDAGFVFHAVHADVEFRKRRFVFTPSLGIVDLSRDTFVASDGGGASASYVGTVKSGLFATLLSLDVAYRVPLTPRLELEAGGAVGVGLMFGTVGSSWVTATPDGELSYRGARYSACDDVNEGIGCRPQDHASPTPVRVGGYARSPWTRGADVPPVLPWVVVPQIALRWRFAEQAALRVATGASVAGFFVALGASFGAFGGGQ